MPKAKVKKSASRARPSYNVKNLIFVALLALLIIPFLAIAISSNLTTSKSKAAGSSCTPQEREQIEMSIVSLQSAFDQKGREWGSCKNTCARLPKDDCPCDQDTLRQAYSDAKNNLANAKALLAKCDTQPAGFNCNTPNAQGQKGDMLCSNGGKCQPDGSCRGPNDARPGVFNCNTPNAQGQKGDILCGQPANGGGIAKCTPDGQCVGPNEAFNCTRYNYSGTAVGTARCTAEKGGGVCNPTTGQCDSSAVVPPAAGAFDCTKPNAQGLHGDVLCAGGFSGASCIESESELTSADRVQGYHVGSCKYDHFDCRNKNNNGQFGDVNCAAGTHCEWSGAGAGQCTANKKEAPPANLNERIQINQGTTDQKKMNCPDGQSTTQDCGNGGTRNCRWHWDSSSNTCQVVGCSSVCYY
jgi:hypothetical protein